jgi:hypothetical protein
VCVCVCAQEESAADTDLLAAADVALHQSIMRRSAEVTLEARAAATALSNVAQVGGTVICLYIRQ